MHRKAKETVWMKEVLRQCNDYIHYVSDNKKDFWHSCRIYTVKNSTGGAGMTRPDFTGICPDVAEYITSLEERIEDITQMLQNLQRLYFGKKSEKIRIPAMEDGAVR